MAYRYYDDWDFKKAMSICDIDPHSGAIALGQYLEKYPLDYTSYPYYISALITIGDFSLAREKINYIQTIVDSGFYRNDKRRLELMKSSLLFSTFKLLCCEEKYQEAYNLYLANSEALDNFEVKKIIFYCKMKLGLIEKRQPEEVTLLPYFFRQTLDYQESDFLHHAKKHCADTPYGNEDDESEFVTGFPIEEVFSEIKKYIPSDKRMYPGFVDNMYFFRYDGCGTCGTGSINFIKVITFNNTADFITMYPFQNGERYPHIDLNYMRKEAAPKTRRRSQIDKFKDRYGL